MTRRKPHAFDLLKVGKYTFTLKVAESKEKKRLSLSSHSDSVALMNPLLAPTPPLGKAADFKVLLQKDEINHRRKTTQLISIQSMNHNRCGYVQWTVAIRRQRLLKEGFGVLMILKTRTVFYVEIFDLSSLRDLHEAL